MRWQKGVTLVELLLVIALISILAASTTPVLSNFLARSYLRNKTGELVASLRIAQLNSMAGKNDSAWGVEVNSSEIKMYAVGDASFDQSFLIPASISITADTVVFDRVTGNADAVASITVSSNAGDSYLISVNEMGVLDVE